MIARFVIFALAPSVAAFAPSNNIVPQKSPVANVQLSMGEKDVEFGRRNALQSIFGGASFVAASLTNVGTASALDMDAFMNSELEKDQKNCDPKRDPKCIPKLSGDEALCKYGQSGNAKAEACKRVRAAGGDTSQKAAGKSLGGSYAM